MAILSLPLIQEEHLPASGKTNVQCAINTDLPRNNAARITDHPDMFLADEHGYKALKLCASANDI